MAFALGVEAKIENIAPMCEHHNRQKYAPLEDFRVSLQLQEFFGTGRQADSQTPFAVS